MVFGKNPHVPQDLLNEPLNVVASTAALAEESIARAQALRTTARMAEPPGLRFLPDPTDMLSIVLVIMLLTGGIKSGWEEHFNREASGAAPESYSVPAAEI